MRLFKTAIVLLAAGIVIMPLTKAYALKTLVIMNNSGTPVPGPFHLVSTNPYDRQALSTPPTVVTLTFSQAPRPEKSFIRLYNMNGDQLDTGELTQNASSLSVTVSDLTLGKYTVKWRSRCQCDDNNDIGDSFHFTIK